MTVFFIAISILVFIALLAILPSALKGSSHTEYDQLATNVGIAKEQRKKLQRALASGVMDEATYQSELSQLENNLALDVANESLINGNLPNKASQGESTRGGMFAAALITLFIPIASGALYLKLGTPQAVNSAALHESTLAAQQQQSSNQPPALAELLPNLEKKLEANPEDRDGWKLLGKSYLTISEFGKARHALMRAYNLDNQDPDLLAQLAEATAMMRDGNLAGEASQFLDDALALNPNHEQSLWLKAIASQQAGKHKDAIERFEGLRAGVADNPGAIASIDEMINKSKAELGIAITPIIEPNAQTANTTNTADNSANNAAKQGTSLSVTVSLDAAVVDRVKPSDSVFIFARASNGPPMPLAVSRHTVADLPVTVVLDDSMAMIPAMTLSTFPSVTVGARVSQSGNAIAQPGDWFTEQDNVVVADLPQLQLTIDTQK